MKTIVMSVLLMIGVQACTMAQNKTANPYYDHNAKGILNVSNAEWKKVLPADAYHILREEGTERAGTGQYVNNHDQGVYYCLACGNMLFHSSTKFESGTGWPSFYQPAGKASVKERTDNSAGMVRTEVLCARCGGHLGHVFDDGPRPTGLRYCMNGNALMFEKK